MPISTRPLTDSFGVEIQGVDLNADIDEDTFAEIERHWYENGIALFRGQAFTEPAIINFCRRFGELEIHVLLPEMT